MDDELTLALDAYIKGFDETNDEATKSTVDVLSTANTQETQTNKGTEATSDTTSHTQKTNSSDKATSKDKKDEFYDDIYFSSGSSEDMSDGADADRGKKKQKKNKRRKLTNDELLYDPNMDKEDEKWVNRQRMAYRNGIQDTLVIIIILLNSLQFDTQYRILIIMFSVLNFHRTVTCQCHKILKCSYN